jgi:ADP-ribose pyrophosphatase YjhB (NUDIX family)
MDIRREVQAVIYDKVGTEVRVLLVKKLDFKNYNYRWRLLKGGIEKNETEEEAIRREISEEVGLRDILIMKKIFNYEFNFEGTLHQVTTFAVKGNYREIMKIQTEEIMDAMWMPIDKAVSLLFWPNEKEAVRKLEIIQLTK